ncbi:MAG: adenylyltransferase/cytidyltransferase family protein [Dysosmobacter sp.]
MKTAIYPGSFDPITLGHLDIIRRSAPCFDRLFVCVMVNCDKKPMFSADERVDMIRRSMCQCGGGALQRPAGGLRPAEGGGHSGEGRPQHHGF